MSAERFSSEDRVDVELQRIQHAQSSPLVMAFGTVLGIALLATLEWVRHPGPLVLLWAVTHLLILTPYLVRETWARRELKQGEGSFA